MQPDPSTGLLPAKTRLTPDAAQRLSDPQPLFMPNLWHNYSWDFPTH